MLRILLTLFPLSLVFSSEIDPARDLCNEIADIRCPTIQELYRLQDRLINIDRPILDRMKETGFIPRTLKFIGESPDTTPVAGRLVLNCRTSDRRSCIIIYSSFNQRYPQGVKRLLDHLSKSDYKGHVYYKIGGWPNIKNGDLSLIHVPFAFKPCFFKEVQELGYKKVLWLDASILPSPQVSLNLIFDIIKRIGFFIQANDHTIGNYMNEDSAAAFGLTLEETKNILSCSASIIGIDFENRVATSLLDDWYKAAHHPFAFFSDRSDQNALSILIHQKKLTNSLIPRNLLGSLSHPEGSLFIMDRTFVKDN